MTNQEAIVYLEGQWDCMCSEDCQIYTGHKDCPQGFICNDGQALLTAISALKAQDSPKPTAESVQNVQNEDLILRKAAIEAMSESLKRVFPEHRQIAEKCLKALPSAQPEIIRCLDCKYWREHKYAKETKKYIPFCGFNAIYTKSDDFCSKAERRTDEPD